MSEATVLTRLTATHWVVVGAGVLLLVFVLILNCFYKNRRWRAVQEARSGLVSAEFLTMRDLPKHSYEIIAKEAEKERNTRVQPKWRDDCGWGRPRSEYAGVHFKTFIASSIHILETHALKRDPSLRACVQKDTTQGKSSQHDFKTSQLACDVGDYMKRLYVAMDGELDDDLCSQYLAFYRNARLPGRQCTEQEFRSFLGVFQEILRRIQR